MPNSNNFTAMSKTQETKTTFTPRVAEQTRRRQRRNAATTGGRSVALTLLRTIPLYPISKMVTGMVYYEPFLSISAGIGTAGFYNFRANDLFDPNQTSTGHQPMGFDQMMNLYEQFTVLRSHIKVTFLSNTTAAARVAVFLNPDAGTLPITGILENGLVKTDVVVGEGDGTHRMKTLEMTCDVPIYFGKTRGEILADPQMYGTVAGSPGEVVHFMIAAWNPLTAAASGISFDVTLSYDAVFWEPKKLASS